MPEPSLKFAETEFRQAFLRSPVSCALLDTQLRFIDCNEAYERNAGLSLAQMRARTLFEVFPPGQQQREALLESIRWALDRRETHRIHSLHYPIATPVGDGRFALRDRWWTITNTPLLDADGAVFALLHQPTDVTELTQLLQQRAASAGRGRRRVASPPAWTTEVQDILSIERERMQQLFEQAPGFICVLRGPDHVFELANAAYHQLIGHRRIVGYPLAEVLPEVVSQGIMEKLDRVLATGEPFIARAMPLHLQRVPGAPLELRHIDLIYQPIVGGDGKVSGIFVQGHDVSEAHALAREVAYQSAHDPLTGLCNRREFTRLTADLAAQPGTHVLMYLDLDHFKIVNDRGGHAAGDALLQQVARIFERHVRKTDLLARLGGDEFALVLRDCADESVALRLADQIRERVRDLPFVWEGRRFGVTLSAGLAVFGQGARQPFNEALSLADAACFLAKAKGRDRVQASRPSDEELHRQRRDMDWAERIRECLREGRVVLHGQRFTAVCDSVPEDCDCQEVLARLLDADGQLVSPALFIPAAERFGLIAALDLHIIGLAFAKLQAIPAARRARTRYFINVSGHTLSTTEFASEVLRLQAQHPEVAPFNVCFEVTETAAVSNLAQTADVMRALVALGYSFALDDFGSGMSSFSYLRNLPVQYVKIDGEFIRGILDGGTGAVIVEAVARVARSMGILTVAEFVETADLLPHLQRLGIHYAQGFGLHRPEPI